MLDAAVLLHAGRIGQHHRILQGLQPVHQPIPVIGGLDRHPFQSLLERREKLHHLLELARQLPARQSVAIQVHNPDHHVVAMQIHSSYDFIHWSPFSSSVVVHLFRIRTTTLLPRGDRLAQPPTPLMLISPDTCMATHSEARFRDGEQAVRLAARAAELTRPLDASALDTLAAAYPQDGRVPRRGWDPWLGPARRRPPCRCPMSSK